MFGSGNPSTSLEAESAEPWLFLVLVLAGITLLLGGFGSAEGPAGWFLCASFSSALTSGLQRQSIT